MYERGKEVSLESSVGLMVKNLQVVSFDSEWLEIYLGTVSLYNTNHKQLVRQITVCNVYKEIKLFMQVSE